MKNYTLILLLFAILVNGEYSYAQPSSDINTEKVVVKRYGLALSGRYLDFMYEFVYPTSDTLALPKIKEQMLEAFFGQDLPKDKLKGNFNDRLQTVQTWYENEVINSYSEEVPQIDGWPGVVCSYNFKTSAIKNVHNKILVFYIDERYADGIAHGRHDCTCINYNLQTGDKISLQNLFDDANLKKLDMIVNEVLKSQGNYTVGSIENFIMLPKGIQFVYDEYIAGCYADGTVRATIPLSKFRHLLKESALTYFER